MKAKIELRWRESGKTESVVFVQAEGDYEKLSDVLEDDTLDEKMEKYKDIDGESIVSFSIKVTKL